MRGFWKKWLKNEDALAALEAGMLLPVMASILLGVVDLGTGLNVNLKAINSSHVISDLLAREDDISNTEFNDAVTAGRLVIMPYDTSPMGYDVAGIQFLDDEETPTEIWRDTFNMEENVSILGESEGMGAEDEGVIGVTVRYEYQPFFSNFIIGTIEMEEVAFARGRKGLFVTRSE